MSKKTDRDAFMKLARSRYDQAEEADKEQMKRELDDLRFYADDQWEASLKASRAGQDAAPGMPPVPARPCLVINKLRDPIRHVEAEAQQTDLGPEIIPADDFSALVGPIDETEIELREGLVRKIQRESQARDARNWAAQRARIAGRGYYVVMTKFTSSRSMDQEVFVDKLYNQNTVRLDPRHEQADGSDADWGFYGTDMSWEMYKAEHPDRESRQDSDDDAEWRGLGDEAPDWFTSDGDTRSVRVMNYFYTEREAVTLVQLQDGSMVPEDQAGDQPRANDAEGKPVTRRDIKKSIKWAKIDGAQVLDETDWESPYIPIVKVVGEELQPFDTQRRYQGMVRPARDSQIGFNVMATTEVEVALMLPKTPIIGYAGQFEGFEEAWNQANVRNIGRLEANAKTDQTPPGTILPLPQALQRTADVGTFDGLRNMFDQAIRSTTGTPDSTLGNIDPGVRSGRAVKALIESAKQGTSGYLANLVKSVTYEAKIINSLLYPIYGRRPGRLLQMMTGKHEATGVMVGTPFVRDAKQRPTPYDPNQHQGQQPQTFKLSEDAEFNVAIRVSKDYDTLRQEEASTLGELIGNDPQLMTWFGDLYFENQDGPGHKDMAERAKLMLAPPILQKLAEKDGQGQIPPQVQAQMTQLQQQLQQASEIIKTDQVKQHAALVQAKIKADTDLKKAQFDADQAIRLQQMKNAAAIAVARISASKEAMLLAAESAEERLATGLEQAHEVGMTVMDHAHEQEMAQMNQAHAQDQQAAQQAHEADQAQQAQAAAQQEPGYGAGV